VGSIEGRLRRLEERGQGGRCPECGLPPNGPGYLALVGEEDPDKSFAGDPAERCGCCVRYLYTVIRVVYDEPEGGGA
jgi:hypothetical protein